MNPLPLALAFALSLMGCSLTPQEATSHLDDSLAEITREDVQSAVMWVDAPRHGIQRGFAHGVADVETGAAMTVETPFYSASVGKLFVATAVLSLVADGALCLDTPVTQYVPRSALSGLPIGGGDAAFDTLTVGMLLSHRSGLPDYFSDPSSDGAPRLFDEIVRDRDHLWTRPALFDYARAHYTAVDAPGETFHYADTNYDILGLVLEGVEGQPFHQVVRARVLEPMGLSHTWYHAFEPAPPDVLAPADVWVLGENLRGARSLSADQAGGGLITTAADLRDFMRGLVDGDPVPLSAFGEDFSLDAMHRGIDVGRGLWRIRPGGVTVFLRGMPTLVGHSGATGVWAYYAADWDAVLVGAVSDAAWQEQHIEFLLREVVPVLARTQPTD